MHFYPFLRAKRIDFINPGVSQAFKISEVDKTLDASLRIKQHMMANVSLLFYPFLGCFFKQQTQGVPTR